MAYPAPHHQLGLVEAIGACSSVARLRAGNHDRDVGLSWFGSTSRYRHGVQNRVPPLSVAMAIHAGAGRRTRLRSFSVLNPTGGIVLLQSIGGISKRNADDFTLSPCDRAIS